MIISPGRRYIFVHIPKTGGTALALALEARAMKDDILIGDTPKAIRRRARLKPLRSRGRLWKHATLADAAGAYDNGAAAHWLAFTLVRNPWDRVVSYYHWLRAQTFEHPAVALSRGRDFTGFLNDEATRAALAAAPYAAALADAGWAGQRLFIRLENFAEDARPLSRHLGFDLELPRANRSERGDDYRDYFDAADRDLVARLCAEDIARFGYTF